MQVKIPLSDVNPEACALISDQSSGSRSECTCELILAWIVAVFQLGYRQLRELAADLQLPLHLLLEQQGPH